MSETSVEIPKESIRLATQDLLLLKALPAYESEVAQAERTRIKEALLSDETVEAAWAKFHSTAWFDERKRFESALVAAINSLEEDSE